MKIAVLAIALFGVAHGLIVCPQNYCASVDCAFDASTCNGEVKANGGFCGCCDTCVETLAEGGRCFGSLLLGIPATKECGTGLHCDSHTYTCKAASKRATDGPCALEHQKYQLAASQHMLGMTEPKCDNDGNYLPKQCSGSRCYCVSNNGTSIEGYGANVWEAQHMNCQCARDQHEYMATGLIGRMFYCADDGNYQKYRCFGSVCHCTDINGNFQAGSQPVNIGMLDTLKC